MVTTLARTWANGRENLPYVGPGTVRILCGDDQPGPAQGLGLGVGEEEPALDDLMLAIGLEHGGVAEEDLIALLQRLVPDFRRQKAPLAVDQDESEASSAAFPFP